MNPFKQLLENDCSPFVNSMGATSTFIDNKVSQATSILNDWEIAEKAHKEKQKQTNNEQEKRAEAIRSQNLAEHGSTNPFGNSSGTNPNQRGESNEVGSTVNQTSRENVSPSDSGRSTGISSSDLTPMAILSMSGINPEDLQELKSCCAEAKKISDTGRNYGKETNADFLTRMTTLTTYLQHKNLSTGSSEGCNWVKTAFSVGAGLGKLLLNSIGLEMGKVTGMLGQLKGWIELGLASIEMAQEISKRIMQAYSDVKTFIKNIKQNIKDLANQLKTAIKNELNAISEMAIYNARMMLAGFLGQYANDPCISGVMDKMGSSAMKRLLIK